VTPTLLHRDADSEVWHGDSLDAECAEIVMAGRVADLLHVDAPYSARTHDGHRDGKATADRAAGFGHPSGTAVQRYASRRPERADIDYASWDSIKVHCFGEFWLPRVSGWVTTVTDHVLSSDWAESFESGGRYVFPPLPWVEMGSRVRMTGDGPSQWSCQLIVARPRTRPWSKWGTLPGAYVGPGENHQNRPERITGGKSLALTCALIGDYSRPGQLVLDPCFGGATTGMACKMTGRRVIGIESDHARAETCARLMRDGRMMAAKGQETLF